MHQWEDTDHVYAIVRTSLWVTCAHGHHVGDPCSRRYQDQLNAHSWFEKIT